MSYLDSIWTNTNVTCINAPQLTVVSGPISEVETLETKIGEKRSRPTALKVPYGFHSHHVEPVLQESETVANGIVFNSPITPITPALLEEAVEAGKTDFFSSSYLARQARERVDFVGALQACEDTGLAKGRMRWIEIGPEPIYLGLIRRPLDTPVSCLLPVLRSSEDNWTTLSSRYVGTQL